MNDDSDDELFDIKEVAQRLRVPVGTLRYWRYLGSGPRSFRMGRHVRYWRSDVQRWLRGQGDDLGPDAA